MLVSLRKTFFHLLMKLFSYVLIVVKSKSTRTTARIGTEAYAMLWIQKTEAAPFIVYR